MQDVEIENNPKSPGKVLELHIEKYSVNPNQTDKLQQIIKRNLEESEKLLDTLIHEKTLMNEKVLMFSDESKQAENIPNLNPASSHMSELDKYNNEIERKNTLKQLDKHLEETEKQIKDLIETLSVLKLAKQTIAIAQYI